MREPEDFQRTISRRERQQDLARRMRELRERYPNLMGHLRSANRQADLFREYQKGRRR